MNTQTAQFPSLESIYDAAECLRGVASHTPLMENLILSERYQANIFLKREDLQIVRSYKIRGAYNKMVKSQKRLSIKVLYVPVQVIMLKVWLMLAIK
jgi:threonine dehydratase